MTTTLEKGQNNIKNEKKFKCAIICLIEHAGNFYKFNAKYIQLFNASNDEDILP